MQKATELQKAAELEAAITKKCCIEEMRTENEYRLTLWATAPDTVDDFGRPIFRDDYHRERYATVCLIANVLTVMTADEFAEMKKRIRVKRFSASKH